MEVLDLSVSTGPSLTLPLEEFQLMPVGDVQLGGGGVDINRFRKQMSWAIEQNKRQDAPPIRFIGMGDYIDIASPSNRAAIRGARLYDSVHAALDQAATKYEDEFLHEVAGTEGMWLGLHHGHHYFEHEDGTTSDTRIANRLGCAFLGTAAFTRLLFNRNQPRAACSCVIWSTHGAGGGIMPQSPLNKLYHIMHSFDADIYLIGHQTKKPVVKMPRLYVNDRGQIRTKTVVLAGTGGFSLGYEQGSRHYAGHRPEGSYVEKAMMSPVALGSILLKIRPVRDDIHGNRIDISVEV